jgi:hypothetical protein
MKVDAGAFKALVKAAVIANAATKANGPPEAGAKARPGAREAKPVKARNRETVVLLSGGNPQIAKAEGDAPVQAYIAATRRIPPGVIDGCWSHRRSSAPASPSSTCAAMDASSPRTRRPLHRRSSGSSDERVDLVVRHDGSYEALAPRTMGAR